MPYVSVDVDVDLDDFDTEDLVEELERRNYNWETQIESEDNPNYKIIREIYELRRLNKDYQFKLNELIFNVTGRII
jgi:hypothetical protein